MAVDPQAGSEELAHPGDGLDDVFGGIRGRHGFGHLALMPAVRRACAADGIRERPHEGIRVAFHVDPHRGPAGGIDGLSWPNGRMRQEVVDVAAQFLHFVVPKHVGEDVETVPPIRLDDLRVNLAVWVETDRPAIPEASRPRHPLTGIALHACRVVGGFEALVHLGHHCNPVGNAHPAPA